MGFNPPPTTRSPEEILDAMNELYDYLVLNVAKEIKRLTSEVESSGSSNCVNTATDKLNEASEYIGLAISALGEARGSLKD